MAVSCRVVGMENLSVPSRRDAGRDAATLQGDTKVVAVVTAIGDQFSGWRQHVKQQACALVVVHLAFGQQQDERSTAAVADGMQLRVQSAFGATDPAGAPFFCRRLADVRCAFRWLESIMIRSGSPAWAARSAKMRLKTPIRVQRT